MTDYQEWPENHYTADGLEVAFTQAATFFNNNTILYGFSFYKEGMTKKEWQEALEANWFEDVVAKAFVSKYWDRR